MRFKFILTIDRQKSPLPILPVQYQYPVSCWIYKVVRTGNSEYRGWLQRNSFTAPRQVFPQFTFSNFLLNRNDYDVKNDRLLLLSNSIEMIFSYVSSVDAEEYVMALFRNQQFSIGDKKSRVFFRVNGIEKLPGEEFSDNMRFRSLSPLLLCRKTEEDEKQKVEYVDPSDKNFSEVFLHQIANTFQQNNRNAFDESQQENMQLKMLKEPEMKEVLVKAGTSDEQRIKAYNVEFEISAPAEMIKKSYYTGFGSMSRTGFGCMEILPEEENPFDFL